MRALLGIIMGLACLAELPAQDMAPDTILNLRDVTVSSSRSQRFATGQSLDIPDSLVMADNPMATLADLLPAFTSSMIRNYGPGTLSTLSFRGTSANHTALLWNGIRLAPPNIGYLDISLIQANFFNDISVLHGGAASMFGSGAVGASINLDNKPVFGQNMFRADLAVSAGSFANYASDLKVNFSSGKIYSSTGISFMSAKNDFRYDDLAGESLRMDHAEVIRPGFIQDVAFLLPRDQYIMASAWFQYADRQIPPTLTEDTSAASQMDRSWRTMLLWKDFNRKSVYEAKLAYFNEFTRYTDPITLIYSVIKSQSVSGLYEGTWEILPYSAALAGLQYQYETADLVNYLQPRHQQSLALYLSYRQEFAKRKWKTGLNLRQEFLTGYSAPFLFSVGIEGMIWRFVSVKASISRNFRAPTLNERFWVPGGNPDIKPETSWNEEAGIVLSHQPGKFNHRFSITFFNSLVDNWILWLPVTSSYWAVENAQEVWSRGIEIGLTEKLKLSHVDLLLAGSYTFAKATNEKKLYDLDASYKQQLIYTPLHKAQLRLGLQHNKFRIAFKGNYTGRIYTSKDNLQSLPPFFLLDAVIAKTIIRDQKHPVSVQVSLNNIFNLDYEITPYRPMPGFNFMLTVKMGLNKQTRTNDKFLTNDEE